MKINAIYKKKDIFWIMNLTVQLNMKIVKNVLNH